MKDRIAVMRLITQLDIELSRAGSAISARQKRRFLSRCTRLHDDSHRADEHFIDLAVLWLLRKHGLQLEAAQRTAPARRPLGHH
jgi:hypothetical protein